MIRPTLEYCSGVWDPYTADLVKKVGKIQRRAVRMVHNNYDWTVSVNALTKDLDLDPLSLRRKTSRLVTLHKAIAYRGPCSASSFLPDADSKAHPQISQHKILHSAPISY